MVSTFISFSNVHLSALGTVIYLYVLYITGMPDYIMKQKNAAIRLARRRYEDEKEEKENARVVVNREPNNEPQGQRVLLM